MDVRLSRLSHNLRGEWEAMGNFVIFSLATL
jgi:hypothetical protein